MLKLALFELREYWKQEQGKKMKPSVQSVDVQWGKCLTNFKAYYDIKYMRLYMQVNVGNAVHNFNTQG